MAGFGIGCSLDLGTFAPIGTPTQSKYSDPRTNVLAVGDSITYGDLRGKCFLWWLMSRMRGRFNFPQITGLGTNNVQGWNMARSGQTTTQMAARKSSIAAACQPGDILFIMGGQNNDSSDPSSVLIDDVEEIIDACSPFVKKIVLPVPPTTSVTGTVLTRKNEFDSYFNTLDREDVLFLGDVFNGVDFSDSLVTWDGVHPTNYGAYLIAKKIEENGFDDLFEVYSGFDLSDYYDTNLLTNTDFTSGWSLSNSTGVTVAQTSGSLDGATSKILTGSGSTTSADTFRFRRSQSSVNINSGDELIGMLAYSLSNSAQDGPSVGVNGIQLSIYFGNVAWNNITYVPNEGRADDATKIGPNGIVNEVMRTASENVAANITSVTFDVQLRLDTSLTPDFRLEFSKPTLYNKTQEES